MVMKLMKRDEVELAWLQDRWFMIQEKEKQKYNESLIRTPYSRETIPL
jgi:hypothetical protein